MHPLYKLADDVCAERGGEYNQGPISRQDYFPTPLYYATYLRNKVLRIESMLWQLEHNKIEVGEIEAKIAEALRDLVNYAKFTYDGIVIGLVPDCYAEEMPKMKRVINYIKEEY